MRKTWGMTEGSIACGTLIVAGFVLQLATGPVRWDAMAWPVNLVVLIGLLLGIFAMHLLRHKVRLVPC